MIRAAVIIALVVAGSGPALAAELRRTPGERDRLVAKCVSEYGAEHADRCIQIIDPDAVARRAYRDFYRHYRQGELERERICWAFERLRSRISAISGPRMSAPKRSASTSRSRWLSRPRAAVIAGLSALSSSGSS